MESRHILATVNILFFRIHFVIKNKNGELLLQNTSMNGTYVNRTLVDEKLLVSGDVVSILKCDYEIFMIDLFNKQD